MKDGRLRPSFDEDVCVGTDLGPVPAERSSAAIYNRLINAATYPAPNPLSIFTTLTFDAHEFIIPNNAATPLKAAP